MFNAQQIIDALLTDSADTLIFGATHLIQKYVFALSLKPFTFMHTFTQPQCRGLSSAPPIPAGIQSFQWNEIQQKALLIYLFWCFPFRWILEFIQECSLEWTECRKFQKLRVCPSTLPPICLVQIPHDKNATTPGHCCTVLDSSLPPTIVNLFISCTNPSSNLDPHLSQGNVQAIPPQLASFSRVSTQLPMGPAFTSHMVDIYMTHISLGERMRETGWQREQQEATRFKTKQKVMIYLQLLGNCEQV